MHIVGIPDEALRNSGSHLRSNLFDIHVEIYFFELEAKHDMCLNISEVNIYSASQWLNRSQFQAEELITILSEDKQSLIWHSLKQFGDNIRVKVQLYGFSINCQKFFLILIDLVLKKEVNSSLFNKINFILAVTIHSFGSFKIAWNFSLTFF